MRVRLGYAEITASPPAPPVSAHIYLRGVECSVRTRLVSIPLSSHSLLRTCVIEEEKRETEIEVGVGEGGGVFKGQKSERKKEIVVA